MLAEPVTFRNPKTGDSIESRFEPEEVISILGRVKGNFAASLVIQFEERGLSPAQWFWAHKLAHENNSTGLDKTKLVQNLVDWMRVDRIMWKVDDKARIKLYRHENRIDVVYSGGDQARRVGYIEKDTFYASNKCPKQAKKQIYLFSTEPVIFLKAFGKRWGICCVCGKQLENEESVSKGIGPICEGRL